MKKLLAALCALALCLSLVGADVHHAHAEEACAHENLYFDYINDDNEYHLAYCEDCGAQVGEKAAHVLGGYAAWGEDTHRAYCDLCAILYGEEIACTQGTELVSAEGGTHAFGCVDCGRAMGDPVPCTPGGEYSNYGDEHVAVCAECGGDAGEAVPCTPSGEYWLVYEDDGTCKGHYAVCGVCDCSFGELLAHDAFTWIRLNGIWCGYGCASCGYVEKEVEHEWDPDSYQDLGDGMWHTSVCLNCGGQGQSTHYGKEIVYTSTGDAYMHNYSMKCDYCGGTRVGTGYHTADSCDAEACKDCGQEGALVFRDMIEHEVGEWMLENGQHYQICANCEQKVNVGPCEYYCDEDGCYDCGQKNPDGVEHWSMTMECIEEGHFWVCEACGEAEFDSVHFLSCEEENGDWCWYCGEEYPDLQPGHDYTLVSDDTGHWQECWVCGDKTEVESHTASCLDNGYCSVCWEELPEGTALNHFEKVWMNTGDGHWQMCSWCYEITVKLEDHTPSATDKDVCSVCNGKIGNLDHEHGWKTREIPATCVKDGFLVDNCPTCGIEMGRIRVKATGHQYGEFADNGDGTQTAECTVCGETVTEKIEAAAEPAPAVEGEGVPENAVLEVKAVEEIAVDEDVLAAIEGIVEKAFTVALIVDEAAVQPDGEVTVKLPVTDEEIAQLEGKVIMVIAEDGSLTEVAFEIVEGELVIKTEILGTFIIVVKAA